MKILSERDLHISVVDAVDARRFDGKEHGLSHCMKAVDFVVELQDRYLFIEIKDPPRDPVAKNDRKKWIRKLKAGRHDEELKYKYRDSFLYEWAAGRAGKPVHYLVLIALDTLDDAALLARQEELTRKLPRGIPKSATWTRPIAAGCGVFNIASWNRTFPHYPIERTSDAWEAPGGPLRKSSKG